MIGYAVAIRHENQVIIGRIIFISLKHVFFKICVVIFAHTVDQLSVVQNVILF